jgi:hypothetical protein
MFELLRIPALQKSIAFLLALVSFCYAYHLGVEWVWNKAIRENSHDGQIGLGAGTAGLMLGAPVAFIAYRVSMSLLRAWEMRHTQKLDEQDR